MPCESKPGERRVALLPDAVAALVNAGNGVLIEAALGEGVGIPDGEYRAAGAEVTSVDGAWDAGLVVRVKELQQRDVAHLPRQATIFSFHQLPNEPHRTRLFAERLVTAIGFEQVRDGEGRYPLLTPMSSIAGRMAVEVALRVLGRAPRRVLILGAGAAGLAAARQATRDGAQTVVLTRSERSAAGAREQGFEAAIASADAIEREAVLADLVVGAVWNPGSPTPKLLPRSLVRRMRRGAMIADVCIDGGGVAETSRPTTHADPTYVDEGVVHYCVANIPAADPTAAAAALSAAVAPYVTSLARLGVAGALLADPGLRAGVLLWRGQVCQRGIAAEAGLPYTALSEAQLTS